MFHHHDDQLPRSFVMKVLKVFHNKKLINLANFMILKLIVQMFLHHLHLLVVHLLLFLKPLLLHLLLLVVYVVIFCGLIINYKFYLQPLEFIFIANDVVDAYFSNFYNSSRLRTLMSLLQLMILRTLEEKMSFAINFCN
jgi:hypothetical protein